MKKVMFFQKSSNTIRTQRSSRLGLRYPLIAGTDLVAGLALIGGLTLIVGIGVTLTGCDHDQGSLPGDRCDDPTDCDPPLVCSNKNEPAGTLGICVYPEAVPDGGPMDSTVVFEDGGADGGADSGNDGDAASDPDGGAMADGAPVDAD
jgi:hypothetical protein